MEPGSTEEKIMKGALAEFAEHGYDGARIDRIAKRAGVNKAMIYYHHKGKEKLYEKIIRDTAEDIRVYIEEKRRKEPQTVEDVITMFEYFTDFLHSVDLSFIRILMREVSSGGKYMRKVFLPNTLLPFMKIFVESAERLMARGQMRDVDPVYTFLQLAGSILYFNLLRVILQDSEAFGMVFRDNYLADFKKNFAFVVSEGLVKGKGEV